MPFDPNLIRKPVLRSDKLPGDATREERISALAQTLYERRLTSSMADAKRLAEGMVDVERKITQQASAKKDDVTELRQSVQHSDSPLFSKVLPHEPAQPRPALNTTLALDEDFAHFVGRATGIGKPHVETAPVHHVEAPVKFGREEEYSFPAVPHASAKKQMFFDEAPNTKTLRWERDPLKHNDAAQILKTPPMQTHTAPPVQSHTEVQASPEGVMYRHVETTPTQRVVEEVAAVQVDEPVAPAPQEREELAKKHGVDLFNIFKVK